MAATLKIPGITLPYHFKPRPYQQEFFKIMDNGCKRYFSRWTRRAGKDLNYWNFVIRAAFQLVGNYYYVFPEYSQGKKAIWEGKTKDGRRYLDYIPPGCIKSMNANEMKIELVNGSIIRIIGSSDIDRLRGAGPRGIVVSEFAYHQGGLEVLNVLKPMLNENDGWLIINSTPAGKNFMYDFEMSISGSPEWHISEIQSLWPDLPNYYPVYSPVDLDEALKQNKISEQEWWAQASIYTAKMIDEDRRMGRTEEFIEQEYGVSYSAGQKGAYYADSITLARKEGRIGNFSCNNNKWVDTFWDLGFSDDTAIWFRQTDGNRLIWVDYYENSSKDLVHFVQVLKEKGYRFRTHYLPHDGSHHTLQTGMSTKDLLTRFLQEARISSDVYTTDRPNNKQIPINLVRERFSRYYFDESNCADGLKKLSLYHRKYDKRLQTYVQQPQHDWTSHAADSIAIEALTGNINEEYNLYNEKTNIITDFDPLDYLGGGSDNDDNYR